MECSLRDQIVIETAEMLYRREGGSYYQARNQARRKLSAGNRHLPHLDEIYRKLEQLVAEREDSKLRQVLLQDMRKEALTIMKLLEQFYPRLIGGVWRGNVRKGSDIDIHVFNNSPYEVLERIEHQGSYDLRTMDIPDNMHYLISLHIRRYPVQISVYPADLKDRIQTCNILRTPITGFSINQLEEVLQNGQCN